MTLYPDVQRRAQEQLDSVVGTDKLPNFGDRERLPYIEALVKEVLRWNPVTPLGMCLYFLFNVANMKPSMTAYLGAPHRLLEDDVHDGYFIPKGSSVIANIW